MINSGDTAWVLVSAAMVLLMTPGLALFYGGMVRRKNLLSTIMMSFVLLGVIGVLWVVYGYSLSFGPDAGHVIGNLKWFGLMNVGQDPSAYAKTIPPPCVHGVPMHVCHHHRGAMDRRRSRTH